MNLVLDIGNTQFKISVFNNDKMVKHWYMNTIDARFFDSLCSEYAITKAIFSDTRGVNYNEIRSIIPAKVTLTELTYNLPLPIKINYQTPKTLGKDRIAAAIAATKIFPASNVLIIDIGTAITIDFVSNDGIYQGGIISPGQELRFKALHHFTGKLPLVEPVENTVLAGKSTIEAIQGGVQNGIIFEINEYISRYNKQCPDLKTIITGGDAYLFDKKIKYAIFAESYLVPIGLNSLIK